MNNEERLKKISVAKELLNEVEKEIEYNEEYVKTTLQGNEFHKKFPKSPRFSIVKDNCKTIRRILLEVSK